MLRPGGLPRYCRKLLADRAKGRGPQPLLGILKYPAEIWHASARIRFSNVPHTYQDRALVWTVDGILLVLFVLPAGGPGGAGLASGGWCCSRQPRSG